MVDLVFKICVGVIFGVKINLFIIQINLKCKEEQGYWKENENKYFRVEDIQLYLNHRFKKRRLFFDLLFVKLFVKISIWDTWGIHSDFTKINSWELI